MSTALGILKGEFGRVALLDLNTSLVRHAHHHCHIVLKASGPARWFGVRDHLHPIADDTAILVNTWEEHFYNHDPRLPQTVFLALYIEPAWLASVDRLFNSVSHPAFFPVACVSMGSRSRTLADTLVEMIYHGGEVTRAEVEAAIFDFTVSLIEKFSDRRSIPASLPPLEAPGDFRIRRAIHFMRSNIGQATEFDQAAKVACLSRPHFNTRFRQCTGVTPAMFANVLRVEHAIGALSQRERNIGDLSQVLGFTEQSNFARFFHQHVGASPREFRAAVESFDEMARPALG
jgi:AraC family transcriptional regulator